MLGVQSQSITCNGKGLDVADLREDQTLVLERREFARSCDTLILERLALLRPGLVPRIANFLIVDTSIFHKKALLN